MRISLGLHLDGERGWRPANRLGSPYLGPYGLLNLLETRLGLLRPESPSTVRVLQYRDCLKRADTPGRFYHASFAVDPLGVACLLLGWRDTWHLHGWTGSAAAEVPGRIADLAAVEALARDAVAPSVGERLAVVAEALGRRDAGIDQVVRVDPLEDFPTRWREVLAKLPTVEAPSSGPQAAEATVLGRLQRALQTVQAGGRVEAKVPWSPDDSLRVVRAETPHVAARWLAETLRASAGDTALIAGAEYGVLDASLDAAGAARQGFLEPSPWAPSLQVLPLALATLWDPLDVYALLQFLSHPMGPLPKRVRRRLARTLADSPGLGGPAWRAAVDELITADPERAEQLRGALAFWIEHPRFRPVDGAPVGVLLERTRAVQQYFLARVGDADPLSSSAHGRGAAQAGAVAEALEALVAQGETRLTPRDLQVLLAQATGSGTPNVALQAEVGRTPAVTEPGALLEPFDRVVWWQMTVPGLPGPYPWSQAEIAALAAAGVDLPPVADVLAARARDWRRPVLNARRQLVLVLPPPAEEAHPLWQEIQWLVDGIPVESIENCLSAATDLPAVPALALPQRRRWWQLPEGVGIPRRERESYSSLDKIINAPHQWVLDYAARLSGSELLAVMDENRLYGTLGHRLLERWLERPDALKLDLEAWFPSAFEQTVTEEGAVLRMRGRRADHERVRRILKAALVDIQQHLLRAKVTQATAERALTGRFSGGELQGSADLLTQNQAGRLAVVDVKWGGVTRFRKTVADGRHLQLAVYAEMVRQETGMNLEVAYFILDERRLITLNTTFFPEGSPVQPAEGDSTAALWNRIVATFEWRRRQLDAGQIEVVLKDVDPTPDSQPPDHGLVPEPSPFDDYSTLVGWRN